ncbi:unnamed protein product [Phyllotreta striolata]|uniref:Uncharacterized protein n=1 Tax=Phyllotreta striolata TaxID=444603 RepID=A0A9N9U0M6_PHYSR|nr:unnamed protein product [Phyllotreta striolata]
MPVNQSPKITINEDYLDLREQSESFKNPLRSGAAWKRKKSTGVAPNLPNEGLQHEKELIDYGLRKLVTSYNNNKKSYATKRKNYANHTNIGYEQKDYMKAQSELSVHNNSAVSSNNSSTFAKKNKKDCELDYTHKTSQKRSYSKSKDDNIDTEVGTIDGINTYRTAENTDARLKDKYTILRKTPTWKRSWTIPVFASKYNLTNDKELPSDRQTYLYDDNSEMDSSYVETRQGSFAKNKVPNQLIAVLFALGAACGIFLASVLIYLIFGNNLVQMFFEPKKIPERGPMDYLKPILYAITSFFSTVGRILSLPAASVNEPSRTKFPPDQYI